MSKVVVGIDVSKKDLSITMIVNDKSYYCNITNDTKGFKEFSRWLKLYKVERVKACMESTGIYSLAFADYLFSQKHEVSIVTCLY
jgi:transposase